MKRAAKSILLVALLVLVTMVLGRRAIADRAAQLVLLETSTDGGAAVADRVVVQPVTSTVVSGQVFTVGVQVEGAVDLAGYKFDLTYDPAVVDILDVEDGGFLEESGRELGSTLGPINLDADTVRFEAFSVPPGDDPVPGSDGSGRLAVVTAKAITVGQSPLVLEQVLVYNAAEGEGESPDTSEGGVVVVGPCQNVSITGVAFDTPVVLNQEVTFNATLTGSKPISYTWDFGDGSPLQSGVGMSSATHTYSAVDTYTLTLKAENVCPSQATYTTVIIVQDVPDIEVTPLSFSLETNEGETFDKLLTIANVGGAPLTWDLEAPGLAWLSATPLSGTVASSESDMLTLSFDASGLTVGETYSTTLVINNDDPDENPVEVPVELEVKEGLPDIEVAPASFAVTLDQGQRVSRTLTIANVGGATLTWDLDEPAADWLTTKPLSGTVAAAGSDETILGFDAGGLTVGETYATTLIINSNDPNEDPLGLPVSLTVEPCRPVEIQSLGSNSPVGIGETMVFTAAVTGTPPYAYAWDFGGAGTGPGSGLGTANPTWTYAEAGDYTVTLTATNACDTDVYTDVLTTEVRVVYWIYAPIIMRSYTP